jgi:hypothetical protein
MATRDKLAEELLDLRKKHEAAFAREKEIKKLLIADANGENFQVTIKGLGVVKVSAAKDKRCTGQAPELVIDAFLAMPQAQRDRLKDKGVVKIVEQWTGAYYGSVTPELF